MSAEHKFLHDIASPLAVVCALVEDVLERLRGQPNLKSQDLAELEESLRALDRISTMLQQRRDELGYDSGREAA